MLRLFFTYFCAGFEAELLRLNYLYTLIQNNNFDHVGRHRKWTFGSVEAEDAPV